MPPPDHDRTLHDRAAVERILLAGLLAAFALHAYWLRGVAEDAFITFRYARHLAEGRGFVWNPGEPPVEGFTSLLWVLVCAAFHRLGVGVPLASQIAGTLAALATLLVIHRLARTALALDRASALFVVALCAAAGPLACWAASGMETAPFALAVACAVYAAARVAAGTGLRYAALAALAAFVATLTRPEGAGVFGLLAMVAFARWPRVAGRRGLLGAWTLAGVYLPLFAVYFAWRYAEFGHPLPNTFYAKTGGGLHQVVRGTTYTAFFAVHYLVPLLPWLALAAWERTRPGRAADKPSGRVARPLPEVLAVVLGYGAYIVAVGGDYMAMYRFWAPIMPLAFALAGLAVHDSLRASRPVTRGRALLLAALVAATIGALLVHSTPLEARLFAVAPGTHGTWRGVQVERWHVHRFAAIADVLAREQRTPHDRVLTYDIGVLGYRLPMRIDDALGITDPVIAHQSIRPGSTGSAMAGHEKQDLAYSFSKAPTFFMYTVRLRPEAAEWPRLPAAIEADVRARYERRVAWIDDAANGERGYFTYLARVR